MTGQRTIGQRTVTILGSTGSVGASTVDLILSANRDQPGRFQTIAVTAQSNARALADQAHQLNAKHAAIGDARHYQDLKERLNGSGISCAAGPDAIIEAAMMPADLVMASIVGTAGLRPALAAVGRGAQIALANKECLVTAGAHFMAMAARHNAKIIPVDSEHSAIHQVLEPDRAQVSCVTLTASGGPFRDATLAEMAKMGPREACAHPNWSMGAKISVDSATLMNKGLELIEASHLFGLSGDQLDVLVHRQSIVHALVAYRDGSVLAQMSVPDMRTPIAFALGYPNRLAWPARRLDLAQLGKLTFEAPDTVRFPCLALAIHALRRGGGVPTVLNAANEVAVGAFLSGRLPFLAIAQLAEKVLTLLDRAAQTDADRLEPLLALDAEARRLSEELIPALARTSAVA